ncbi:MAG: hypothetical protein KDB14_12845, partial [Planctomycetales bacterium]|nr:hypothetical protein [Planctomycetales bacterium]
QYELRTAQQLQASEQEAWTAEREQLGAASDELHTQVEQLRAELTDTQQRHTGEQEAWTAERKQLKAASDALQAQLEKLHGELADDEQLRTGELEAWTVERDQLRSASDELHTQNEKLEKELARVRKQLATEQSTWSEERGQLLSACQSLGSQVQAERDKVSSDVETLRAEIEAAKQAHAAADSELQLAKQEAADQTASWEQQRTEWGAALDELRSRCSEAITDRDGARQALAELQSRLDGQNDVWQQEQSRVAELEQELQELHAVAEAASTAAAEQESLAQEVDTLRQEYDRLQVALHESTAGQQQAELALEQARGSLEAGAQTEYQLEQLRAQCELLVQERDTACEQQSRLMQEVEQLTRRLERSELATRDAEHRGPVEATTPYHSNPTEDVSWMNSVANLAATGVVPEPEHHDLGVTAPVDANDLAMTAPVNSQPADASDMSMTAPYQSEPEPEPEDPIEQLLAERNREAAEPAYGDDSNHQRDAEDPTGTLVCDPRSLREQTEEFSQPEMGEEEIQRVHDEVVGRHGGNVSDLRGTLVLDPSDKWRPETPAERAEDLSQTQQFAAPEHSTEAFAGERAEDLSQTQRFVEPGHSAEAFAEEPEDASLTMAFEGSGSENSKLPDWFTQYDDEAPAETVSSSATEPTADDAAGPELDAWLEKELAESDELLESYRSNQHSDQASSSDNGTVPIEGDQTPNETFLDDEDQSYLDELDERAIGGYDESNENDYNSPQSEEELEFRSSDGSPPESASEVLARLGHAFDDEEDDDEPAPAAHVPAPRADSFSSGLDDDEPIEEYMEQLLMRVRGGATEKPAAEAPVSKPKAKKEPAARPAPAPAREKLDLETYRPNSEAPEKSGSLRAMRELANDSARDAISQHAERDYAISVTRKRWMAWSAGGVSSIATAMFVLGNQIAGLLVVPSAIVAAMWLRQSQRAATRLKEAKAQLAQKKKAQENAENANGA